VTSAIDPSVIIDNVPVSKAAVRAQLEHARNEITELQRLLVTQTTQPSSSAYALTFSEPVSYVNGQVFRMRLNAAADSSATTVTLNVNGQGAVPIKEWNGRTLVDVPGSRFVAGAVMTVVYNSAVPCFMLIDATHPRVGKFVYTTMGGTNVAISSAFNLHNFATIDIEITRFIPQTAGQDLLLQVSTDNGTNYLSSNYVYSNHVLDNSAASYEGSATASGWKLAGPVPTVSPQYFAASIRVFTGPSVALAHWVTRAPHASNGWHARHGSGHVAVTGQVNAVRLLMSGGALFTVSAQVIV